MVKIILGEKTSVMLKLVDWSGNETWFYVVSKYLPTKYLLITRTTNLIDTIANLVVKVNTKHS